MSMPGPPHSEPPRWPGHTSVSGGEREQLLVQRRNMSRAPSSFSTARSGRAMSPTNRVSPVSTAQGSSPRAVSISANAVCSGRCPGVWRAAHPQRAQLELDSRRRTVVLVVGARGLWTWMVAPVGGGQPAVAGDVIGVVVGLEHMVDVHAQVAGQLQVLVDLEARVHHGGDACIAVADEIGGAAQVVVRDLPEDHGAGSCQGD